MLPYRIEGEGPPLVLIHGFGISFMIWQELAPLLRARFQLIPIELPGINRSPAPEAGIPYYSACAQAITALRESLDIAQWSVLSYSAGTRIAEVYLQQDAAHIANAVFLCPVRVAPPAARTVRLLCRVNRHQPGAITWLLSGPRFGALLRMLAFNGQAHPYVDTWAAEITRQPMSILKATLLELPGGGETPFALPSLPVRYIWARHDLIAPPPHQLCTDDCIITSTHAAPMLAAPAVAEAVFSFCSAKNSPPI